MQSCYCSEIRADASSLCKSAQSKCWETWYSTHQHIRASDVAAVAPKPGQAQAAMWEGKHASVHIISIAFGSGFSLT